MSSPGPIDAIILDVDGTLYHQGPVRRQMALNVLMSEYCYLMAQ